LYCVIQLFSFLGSARRTDLGEVVGAEDADGVDDDREGDHQLDGRSEELAGPEGDATDNDDGLGDTLAAEGRKKGGDDALGERGEETSNDVSEVERSGEDDDVLGVKHFVCRVGYSFSSAVLTNTMPLLRVSASDVTATVKASAQVNAAVGGASSRGGNSAPPPAGGFAAASAVVTQSAVAKSGSGTFSLLRTILTRTTTGPIARRITWSTAGASVPGITSLASATNGMIVYNARQNDGVYKTINGGVSWTKVVGLAGVHTGIACSNDGSKVIVANFTSTNVILTSTDGGATFTTTTSPAPGHAIGWVNTYVTGDGSLFMVADNSNFYTSTNGIAWTLRNSSTAFATSWRRLTVSSDTGSVIYSITTTTGAFRRSIDQGVTWTSTTMPGTGKTIDCSADGTVVVVGTGNSDTKLLVSRDSGVTWSQTALISNVEGVDSISCSESGAVIVVTTESGLVYAALDGGAATLQTISGAVAMTPSAGIIPAVTVSGNGSRILVANANRIFTGTIA
jgi:hypothetical protein